MAVENAPARSVSERSALLRDEDSTSEQNDDPKNWPTPRRWLCTIIVACYGITSPVSASMVVPALDDMSKDLNIVNSGERQLLMSIFVLGWGLGPIILGPLSEVYGRVLVLNTGQTCFIIANTLCALPRDKWTFIAVRLLAGVMGSGPMSIGGGVLSDLWRPEERGLSLAIYTVLPLVGPAIGPIAAGYIVQHWSWPWIFYCTSAFAILARLVGQVILQETYTPVILRKKLRKAGLESQDDSSEYKSMKNLKANLARPFIMLGTKPIVQLLAFFMAYLFGLHNMAISIYQSVWQDQYGQSPSRASLNYIFIAAGLVLGAQLGGPVNDRIYARMKKRNGGTDSPEIRTVLMYPASLIVPAGLLWYGWSAEMHLHWIMPNIGICIFCFGVIVGYQCIQAYVLDCYPLYAASAMGALTVLRAIAGFSFPIFAPALNTSLGYGWASTVLAGCACIIGCSVPFLLSRFGPRLRERM
ncbi:putative bicyclomycin resistance protein [Lophiotrema nucula]|uniref:Putative bicyclomycin resistance protein n=1 Tax=Lophiotrema nucula TaxID=690887 RepID=A0A6A5YKM3_9PLEO|nr:putative bicyclomycin resistance protein [Lophiotrema nucula]